MHALLPRTSLCRLLYLGDTLGRRPVSFPGIQGVAGRLAVSLAASGRSHNSSNSRLPAALSSPRIFVECLVLRWLVPLFSFQPFWTMPPEVVVLCYRSSTTPQVGWILFGWHISPRYPVLVLDFAHPVVHKLLVVTFSSYPVERNCTVRPTVDLVNRISFQGFFHVIGKLVAMWRATNSRRGMVRPWAGGFGDMLRQKNFGKLKPLRRDFRNSDSCKRLSIYLLNRCFSLKALLSYPFLNLPCLALNYIWDRNSSCYEEWLKFEVDKPWFTRKNRYAWLCWSNCILVYKCQSPNLRNATSFIIFSKEL